MSIETTTDKAVALYDSVTGIAFGPVFTGTDAASPEDEAEAFRKWFEKDTGHTIDYLVTAEHGDILYARDHWRYHVLNHDEAVCPFDRDADSYGIGYTGDSDMSRGEYTVSTPDPCGCECHDKSGASRDERGRGRF